MGCTQYGYGAWHGHHQHYHTSPVVPALQAPCRHMGTQASPNPCSWLVVGYSILSHPMDTGVETTATTANPRNGYPALSTKVPSLRMACTIPVVWLEVPPSVLVAKYHPLCWWPSTIRCADG